MGAESETLIARGKKAVELKGLVGDDYSETENGTEVN